MLFGIKQKSKNIIKKTNMLGTASQDGGVGKCGPHILSQPHKIKIKVQNNHHSGLPEIELNRSPMAKNIKNKSHWDW